MCILAFFSLYVFLKAQVLAYPEGPGCGALLTGGIVGKTINVTGSLNSSFDESHALLNSSNAWCSADVNPIQYLLIRLDKPGIISSFEIQGRSSSDVYLKQFRVRYKADDDQQTQDYKIFDITPSNGDEILRFSLNNTAMQTVSFHPSDWNGSICMRVELYGCIPVDGVYTPWSDWSLCSKSCGNGNKIRYRKCSNPAPANNGQDCMGEPIETENCVGTSCPVNGGFSGWSNWTVCSTTCGTGFQIRTRSCTNPPPEHGGKYCEGRRSEGQACRLRACEVESVNSPKTSDDKENDHKYFIPMLVLAVGLALFVVIVIGVCCVMNN